MVSKYKKHCLAHTVLRAFSDTAKAQSHQTEAVELSHDDWQDHCVQESTYNTESTEEYQVTRVLNYDCMHCTIYMYTGFGTAS